MMTRKLWEYVFWPWTLALVVILGLSIRLWQMTRPPNFVLMHNVWVVKRTSPQSFHALVYAESSRVWNEFVVTSCPDWHPTNEIQTGVTLSLLQFVEDHDHNCDELDGRYAGYTLARDDHDQPTFTPDPRLPANVATRPSSTWSGTHASPEAH